MEYSIDTTQLRKTCRIDEEGGNEVDLEFMCLSGLPDSLFSCRLTGHTRSSTARTTPHPFENEVWPNMHWSPANVVTNARPWYKNWLGWCPTSCRYWRKNSV